MTFPVLAIEPKGFTWLFQSQADTERMPVGFVGIYRRKIRELEFFDSDGTIWRLESVEPVRRISFWAHLFSSAKKTEVVMRFRPDGTAGVARMQAALRQAVEADDDILTQFEERSDILAKLGRTKSVGDIFRLYRWMRKDFKKRGEPAGRPNAAEPLPGFGRQ
ncbi:MAG: hypothetical protein H7A46_06725 [Verrucomicrobiales bacterium]|nr:hypothetical protein [Verrucomicrobiales bacterium]